MATEIYDIDKKSYGPYKAAMLTPEQCRAARAWLGWNQTELASRAKVGVSTVRDFETGTRVPIANNREAMRLAFEAAGVTLLFDENQTTPTGLIVRTSG